MTATTNGRRKAQTDDVPSIPRAVPTRLTEHQVGLLAAELDPRRVSKREGSGRKMLSYLEQQDVKRHANRVFGFDGWSYVVQSIDCLGDEPVKSRQGKDGFRVAYRAVVTVAVHSGEAEATRGDVGYGDAVEYTGSRLTPHELAAKEAVSDAVKRCLASWGDGFGLVLYGDDPAPPEPEPATSEAVDALVSLAQAKGVAPEAMEGAMAKSREKAGGVLTAEWVAAQTARLNAASGGGGGNE